MTITPTLHLYPTSTPGAYTWLVYLDETPHGRLQQGFNGEWYARDAEGRSKASRAKYGSPWRPFGDDKDLAVWWLTHPEAP